MATGFKGSFSANVGTLDMVKNFGWNVLQEFVWVPQPRYPLILLASDHLAVSLLNAPGVTLEMGVSMVWEEYGI